MRRLLEGQKEAEFKTLLRKGDTVMVLTGGNPKRQRVLKGQVGRILRFVPKRGRVVVEGLNMIKRHKRRQSMQDVGGIITKEGSIAISNVMYYSEDLKRPVRLRSQLSDGKKVRGYVNPKTKKFEAV
jgi:large subunit ribosomal protein L24